MNAALIVAAGRGTRADTLGSAPKQYIPLAGQPVLAHTIAAFQTHAAITHIQVVIHRDDVSLYEACTRDNHVKLQPHVFGGETRQESVRRGLEAMAQYAPRHVLIHDAARPLVDQQTISAVLAGLDAADGAIAGLPVADTLKRQAAGDMAVIESTVDRAQMWRALTPQGFHFETILDAHNKLQQSADLGFTDDAAIAEHFGLKVSLVTSNPQNIKITTPGDFAVAESFMSARLPDVRTGQGFDVHKFADGDHVWLCGVCIPHDRKLDGHSDADVAMHALTDAILGAIGDGDIGQHFPPSDEQWRGAASHVFLEDAIERVRARGGHISNVDVTIICEEPKVGPHRQTMRARLAEIMNIDIDRIGLKATTSEGLGFTGRREGIAAMATATVLAPA